MALVIIILAFFVVVFFIAFGSSENKRKKESADWEKKVRDLEQVIREVGLQKEELQNHCNDLNRFEQVLDAEKAAFDMVAEAKAEADRLLAAARLELENAQSSSKETLSAARSDAKVMREKADGILTNATREAAKIIEIAKQQAVEIAGDAYEALKNVDRLEQTAKALKNIVEGYGDSYLLPSYTLIDQLADDFGYTEAGSELKSARERTRLMMKNGTAAKCDYVEQNRKETAISFVIDAFNGKVDTCLSEIKDENFGKLQQKIKDAFYLVNQNGTAFRNAAITEEFLKSRLEELRLLAVVRELKNKEREEQRAIKEQIREEEKARRDYERAQREAEKEEDMLKKAMEKLSGQMAQATEEQRLKYEKQLRELEDKLHEAEEKNQRALSMAQQTRTGHIYIISNIGSFGEDVFKIGMTRRLEPLDRIRELGDASVPFEFDVHALILSDDAPTLEKTLHKKFVDNQLNKVNPRKEFFRVGLTGIKNEIETLGIEAKWTMVAEAKQYRESLAIEELLKTNAAAKAEWERNQMELEEQEAEEEVVESQA